MIIKLEPHPEQLRWKIIAIASWGITHIGTAYVAKSDGLIYTMFEPEYRHSIETLEKIATRLDELRTI